MWWIIGYFFVAIIVMLASYAILVIREKLDKPPLGDNEDDTRIFFSSLIGMTWVITVPLIVSGLFIYYFFGFLFRKIREAIDSLPWEKS